MLVLAISVFTMNAMAQEVSVAKELMRVNSKDISAQVEIQSDRSALISVFAKVKYSNECSAPEEKFKSVKASNSKFEYSLYAIGPEQNKSCNSIYLPHEKEILVDQIKVLEGQEWPKISVNEVPATFM